MLQRNLKNFVYQSSTEEKQSQAPKAGLDQNTIEKLMQSLAKQSLREKALGLEELESILQVEIKESRTDQTQTESDSAPQSDDTKSITKYLVEHGYLKDEKNWLTKKGFLAIGNQILRAVRSDSWNNGIAPDSPLDANKVVVGFDTRFLSDRYAAEVARVLAGNGYVVHLTQGDAPTPAISYMVRHLGAIAGVVITASHNAPRYNGVKLKAAYGRFGIIRTVPTSRSLPQ